MTVDTSLLDVLLLVYHISYGLYMSYETNDINIKPSSHLLVCRDIILPRLLAMEPFALYYDEGLEFGL